MKSLMLSMKRVWWTERYEVYGMLPCGALRIPLHFVLAAVFVEVLLPNAVECERGNRTFKERSCHAPWAARAAPAAEVVAVDSDQAFVHK
jgi:hypothetical protein